MAKVNWGKVLGGFGFVLMIGSNVVNSINQKREIAEAAEKAVEKLINKN